MDDQELLSLRRLRDLAHRLAAQADTAKLIPTILEAAVELTGAERGFLVLATSTGRGVRLKVEAALGFDKSKILAPANKVSRTAVGRAMERVGPVLTTSEADRDLAGVTSVRERHVRAILCVPIRLRGRTLGVIYLDHRFDDSAFGERDLPVVASFADQVALALETCELLSQRAREAALLGDTKRQVARLEEQRQEVVELARRPWSARAIARFGRLVGESARQRELCAGIERAARSDAPLLIVGEVGSGKESVAREVHERSPRAQAPLVVLRCRSRGEVEEALQGAQEGTLLLDEVAELSLDTQAALLRALASRSPTVRVVATTRHDLAQLSERGGFRQDLYFRLDVLRLVIPPLRERRDDIPALLAHFFAREPGLGAAIELAPGAFQALVEHAWPGNLRELENQVRRLASLRLPRIEREHLSPELRAERGRQTAGFSGKTLP